MEATDSFKHLRLALLRISSEQILSEIFVFVIVRAAALMALLISSVTVIPYLSLILSLTGIVNGQAAKILPMSRPFAKVI